MRIALVTHQFFPAFYTGVERLTLNLAKQLGRMGHLPLVLTSADHSDAGHEEYEWDGVTVRTIVSGPVDLARPWMQSRRTIGAIERALSEEKVEIVDVMHSMRLPQAFEAAARVGLPVVTHVPDHAYLCARVNMLRADGELCFDAEGGSACTRTCGIDSGRERVEWGRAALESAGAVICPCRSTTEIHRANGFATDRWHHVPWGVDYGLFPARVARPNGERLVIGFAGTLLRHKGPHVLVEAIVSRPELAVELRLWGESFHENAYERQLRERAGDDARISFHGRYEHEGFADLLSGLDLLAVPSLWHENLPTTGLNAIAAGVPLVVSDVGGLVELIDDYRCGFTFPVGDADALSDLLAELTADRSCLDSVRDTMIDPPSLEEEAWRVERIYEELCRVAY